MDWKLSYKQEYSRADAAVKAFFWSVSVLLCFYSSLWMAQDIFPDWQLSGRAQAWACMLAVLICVLYEAVLPLLRRLQVPAALAVPAAFGGACLRYAKPRQVDLEDGACALAAQFLEKFNRHMKTSYVIWAGKKEYAGMALAFWMLVLVIGVLILALLAERRMLLLLLPAAVLGAELVTGYVPEQRGMALFFLALLLVHADGWNGRKLALHMRADRGHMHRAAWHARLLPALCLCAAAALMLAGGGFLSQATSVKLMEKSPDVIQFQRQTERNVSDFMGAFFARRQERVSNQSPQYTGKEMMKVTLSSEPLGDVLLRGCYSTDYRGGNWICSQSKFQQECARAGFHEKDVQEKLLQVQYDSCRQYLESQSSGIDSYLSSVYYGQDEFEYKIEHTGIRTRYAYIPYAVDYKGSQGKEQVTGDVALQKAWGQTSFAYRGWNGFYMNWALAGTDGEPDEMLAWYERFALDAYLDVPENMPSFQEYLDFVMDGASRAEWQYFYETSVYGGEQNFYRLAMASLVSAYLGTYQTYSMNLDTLPPGEDPVRYFLMQSRKGYCVHFASAAALFLRQMGIPARFVSGYAARMDDFQKKGSVYQASVKDWDAHAWIEVYMDGMGWVPVDVTPGRNRRPDDTDAAGGTGQGNTGTDSTHTDAVEEKDNAGDTQADDKPPETGENGEKEDKHAQKPKGGTGNSIFRRWQEALAGFFQTGELEEGTAAWRIFILLSAALLLLVPLLLVLLIVRSLMQFYLMLPQREISAGKRSRAVMRINRRIYRRLYLRGKIRRSMRSDAQYEQALKTVYHQIPPEDWEHFMQAARAVAFSGKEAPEADAGFCYRIYRSLPHAVRYKMR